MNKVDWSKAPKWACWYTEDKDGAVYWENKPVFCEFEHVYWRRGQDNGTWRRVDTPPSSDKHIEHRPTEGDTE